MTISIQRLTLFAIFDALEKDLRALLLSEILPYHNLTSVLNEMEVSKLTDRYIHSAGSETEEMQDFHRLIPYLDFLDSVQIINRNRKKLSPPLAKYLSNVTASLEKCAPVRNSVMHGRPLDIDDFPTICGIASKLAADREYNWPNLSETVLEIENDDSYVFGLRFTILDDSPSGAFHNLPAPDFDDTGFVGRQSVSTKVREAIFGPFPVISLVGEGGVGKTALALKVAYELLDNEDLAFDAIVWVSAKANTLTAKEIKRIEGAIEDSIGVFTSILSEFEPNFSGDPEDRVIDLLTYFKVLLIVDNLETVLDDRLRRFIQRVPKGSKILLTSRIGVAAGDLSVPIEPLTMPESRSYFHKLVQSYSVQRLQKINSATLDHYIKRLSSNPLFLKWFVTAVKAGTMPEKLLGDQSDILKFCLENVMEYLDPNSKLICNAFLVVDGPHSLPMLARLTELQSDEIEISLSRLLTCNVITMISLNELGDTAYQMPTLPRAYLQRVAKLSTDAAAKINRRYRSVQQTIEQAAHYQGEEIYRFENFQIQNRDQALVASDLKRAFSLIRKKEFESAETLLASLISLAPGYFEVERVKAYLKFESGDFVAARQAYEMALELNPDYAPLYFWYGGFLLRAYDDLDGALEAFRHALKLRASVYVEREVARVLMYKGMFDQAEDIINSLLEQGSLSNRHIAVLTDLKIQCYCRNFEHQMNNGELQRALDLLLAARRHGESIPGNIYDQRMAKKYRKLAPTIESLALRLEGTTQEDIGRQLVAWATEFADRGIPSGRLGRVNHGVIDAFTSLEDSNVDGTQYRYAEGEKCDGTIVRVSDSKTFGFIRTEKGDDLFFHQSAVVSRNHCIYMTIGSKVEFSAGQNAKGYCATSVRLKFPKSFNDLITSKQHIEACVVNWQEGTDHGFAIVPEYGELLIRRDDFSTPEDGNTIREGDLIRLITAQNEKGFLGKEIRLAAKV